MGVYEGWRNSRLSPFGGALDAAFPGGLQGVRDATAAALPGGIALVWNLNDGSQRWHAVAPAFLISHWLLLRRWLSMYGAVGPTASRDSTRPDSSVIERQFTLAGSTFRVALERMSDPPRDGRRAIGRPFGAASGALLWMTYRTSAAAIGATFAIAFVWASLVMANGDRGTSTVTRFRELFAVLLVYSGVFATLIVGVGVFLEDLRPRLNHFWRSRPIDSSKWFAIKHMSGLICLAVPFGVAAALFMTASRQLWALSAGEFTMGLSLFLLLYCAAVVACVLVRQPLYAAILGFAASGVTGAILATAELVPLAARVVAILTVAAALTLVAWLAVRYDWALRR